jgi:Putative zinc- or iron-chelating domain
MFAPTSGFLLDSAARAMAAAFPKPTPERVAAGLDEVFALAEQSWEATRTNVSFRLNTPAIACKAGCGWCCHQQVGVSVPEAIRIALHIRSLPAAESSVMTQAVRQLDDRINGLATSKRAAAKLPCAFLADGFCAIYPVRPLRCRGLHSTDVGFCIASFNDPAAVKAGLDLGTLRPVFLGAPQHVYDQALNGVLKALHFAGVADYGLELTAAVRQLLDQPKRMAAWLKQRAAPKSAALVPDPGADLRGQFR